MTKSNTTAETAPMALGVGVDVGTMNLVSARQSADGKTVTRRVRDAFLDLDVEAKKTLRLANVNYIEKDGQLLVLGDAAMTMANLFKRDVRRPLAKGVIAAGELDAQEILSLLLFQIVKEPQAPGEHAYYSVPAAPVDDADQDITYHQEVFRQILSEFGYAPHPTNEAMALIYSQCAGDNFSGLAVSFGSGMCNVALAYQTMMGMSFSVARGGDWIDTHAAKAVGLAPAKVCAIKEKGVDLVKPQGREAQAIALYIRALIRYCLEHTIVQFNKVRGSIDLPEPVPFVLSGGTTRAKGFLEVFREEFEEAKSKKGFPVEISEIRLAKDPMTAVAEGLLVLAAQEHGD
jgi:hypothetical protein